MQQNNQKTLRIETENTCAEQQDGLHGSSRLLVSLVRIACDTCPKSFSPLQTPCFGAVRKLFFSISNVNISLSDYQ